MINPIRIPELDPVIERKPALGIILGSGLGTFTEHMSETIEIPFSKIPGLVPATAPGHKGAFILGKIGNQDVLAMQGRLHFYEGHQMKDVVYPVRLMHSLGVRTLMISNASGGINLDYETGDLMLLSDHINFTGQNPLVGLVQDNEIRFPDMTFAYDPDLRQLMKETAERNNIKLHEGVYIACSGPSYETPAEIRAFRILGADAVGMSTVPEVIVANALGMRVVAVSCIANMAAGILPVRLTEEEVLETGLRVTGKFSKLIKSFVQALEGWQ